MTYQTKLTGIIATNDLPVYLETAFHDDYIDDDNLEDLLDALAGNRVINYTPDFVIDESRESVEELIIALPSDHYFIAIETPVTYKPNDDFPTKCYSWGYTQTTWVFVKSLENIEEFRQMVGKMADETLTDESQS